MHVHLQPHPAHPPSALTSLDARIDIGADGLLVTYELAADIAGLRIPSPAAPKRTDELWKATCFELFLKRAGEGAYCEFNFSPSTQWAAYSFTGARHGMAPIADAKPIIECELTADRLILTARLALPVAPPIAAAVTAVVEDANGAKSYWAVTHPADKPDFHHPDGFVIDLPSP